jgi:hypothetical protein
MYTSYIIKMSAPESFKFSIKITSPCGLTNNIEEYFKPDDTLGDGSGRIFSSNIKSGYHELAKHSIWVNNQYKQGYMMFHTKTREDWLSFVKFIDDENAKKPVKPIIPTSIYKYNVLHNNWHVDTTYQFKGKNDLVGYDHYLAKINKDVDNYIKYSDFLREIGETKSINNLLYGVPGVGKSTLVRTFCSQRGYPMFIINPSTFAYTPFHITNMLNPIINLQGKYTVLLFEDFDRFLEDSSITNNMSQILNSLSGVEERDGIIRFFTGNNAEKIFQNEALLNRMSSTFEFTYPTEVMYVEKLKKLLVFYQDKGGYDQDLFNKFIKTIMIKNQDSAKPITLRPFVSYCLRYLFDDNCLQEMIENIQELR